MNPRVPASRILALLLTCASALTAAPKLASPFGDHMVLQQRIAVPVWGWADAGETVTVEFAGQKKSTTADAAGNWRLALDPIPASAEPRDFVVSGQSQDARIQGQKLTDVLVGDVWLCGGQSNMERHLGLQPGQKPIIGWESFVASAHLPLIRQFYVPHRTAYAPERTTDGAWTVCSPQTAADFSAVGLFFAREIHRVRGVPVGIIHSSYGGTPAEAWTSQDGLADFPEYANGVAEAQRAAADRAGAEREFREELTAWYAQHEPGSKAADPWFKPGRDTSDWEPMNVPGLWEDHGHPDWDGVAWFKKTFEVPVAWQGRELELQLSAIDDVDTTWVNGVEVGSTIIYNAQRTYRIPAAVLKTSGNEIVVRVLDTGGGGGIWEPRMPLHVGPADRSAPPQSLAGPWQVKFSVSLADVPRPPQNLAVSGTSVPTVLYNAMIAPLVPYAIRGAAFYQGESNNSRAAQYRKLLPALIADWRRVWNQGDFPFLFVQIAPFRDMSPELRESQLLAWQETKNTAMVVTMDVGDAQDIHPAEKRPVGERLALAARATVYGEALEYSGPVYSKTDFAGGRATVHFTHVGGGLVAPGGTLVGFSLAGADGVFHPAQAEIAGETVVVASPAVPQPTAVRYGWAAVPVANLFNRAGLPASPFRSDGPK